MKRGIAKEEEMKLGKKTVVTIGVLLSALLCVNMMQYGDLIHTLPLLQIMEHRIQLWHQSGVVVIFGVVEQVIVHIMDQFAIMEDKVSLEITYYVSY